MRIAIIGSGISGLSAAYFLAPHATVTLYEKSDRLGGHAHTVQIPTRSKQMIPVDTGFMVYNPTRYPLLTRLFEELGVASAETTMSFSVANTDGFVMSSVVPTGVFADWRNVFRLNFWFFLYGIIRFNRIAKHALDHGSARTHTLASFLDTHRVPTNVREQYLYPMLGAIWSCTGASVHAFPAHETFRFLDNHCLLSYRQPRWRTVRGGSGEYVSRLYATLTKRGVHTRLAEPVVRVSLAQGEIAVHTAHDKAAFDKVIFACHANEARALLGEEFPEQTAWLSSFTYTQNETVLHGDASHMPPLRRAWASWNYHTDARASRVSVTYWMNNLQHISHATPLFVTLNPLRPIPDKLVYARLQYAHPVFDTRAAQAQELLTGVQGKNGLYFAGAYTRYGFHEDGIASAHSVVTHMGFPTPWNI